MRPERYDFEYEANDDEADDESFREDDEADDEGWGEADDEAGDDEAADDESFPEADDEALPEADDEDDEALIATGVSAQTASAQDRARQAAFARRLAADRRQEAQRANATQRSFVNRIRDIRGSGRTRVYNVGQLQGAGVFTAELPNRRRTQLKLMPAPISTAEVNKLRMMFNASDKRLADANAANSKAIANLSAAQAAAVKKLTEQQVKSDRELGNRIVQGHKELNTRITKEVSATSGVLRKHRKQTLRLLRLQRQRSLANNVLLASSLPLFASYGDRGDPLSKNNLILTGTLLGTLLGDEIVDQFVGRGKDDAWTKGATFWSYLAPFANAGIVEFFLGDKQHQEVTFGVVDINNSTAVVDLKVDEDVTPKIVAVFTNTGAVMTTSYADGKLTLTLPAGAAVTSGKAIFAAELKPIKK